MGQKIKTLTLLCVSVSFLMLSACSGEETAQEKLKKELLAEGFWSPEITEEKQQTHNQIIVISP